jgi:hypothetical protein
VPGYAGAYPLAGDYLPVAAHGYADRRADGFSHERTFSFSICHLHATSHRIARPHGKADSPADRAANAIPGADGRTYVHPS